MSNSFIPQFHGRPDPDFTPIRLEWQPPPQLVGLVGQVETVEEHVPLLHWHKDGLAHARREARLESVGIHIFHVNRGDIDALTCREPVGHRGLWWYDGSTLPSGVEVKVGDVVVWAVYREEVVEVGQVTELTGPAESGWCSRINDRGIRWIEPVREDGRWRGRVAGAYWTPEVIGKVLAVYNPTPSLVAAIVARLCETL